MHRSATATPSSVPHWLPAALVVCVLWALSMTPFPPPRQEAGQAETYLWTPDAASMTVAATPAPAPHKRSLRAPDFHSFQPALPARPRIRPAPLWAAFHSRPTTVPLTLPAARGPVFYALPPPASR